MALDTWLKFGHILGAIVWLGGGFTLAVLATRARRSADDTSIGEFVRTLIYVSPRVLIPAVLAVLVFGVWMVLENAAWNFGQLWVLIALGLFLAAFLIGAIYLSRIGIQLQRLGEGGLGAGDARRLLDRWVRGYAIVLAILVFAVWDMVFKPGL
jgi:uncharacterized membrane protein